MQHRRFACDYKARLDNSASMITVAVIDSLEPGAFTLAQSLPAALTALTA
jgi:hypothetical protein